MSRKPYRPVPSFVRERLTIAAMCGEQLTLHWRDEFEPVAHLARLHPREVLTRDAMDYLVADTDQGQRVAIRLDLIENLPTPVK